MKTDLKNRNKTNKMIVLFFLVSVVGAMVAFMLTSSLTLQVITSILSLVAVTLYFSFIIAYKEHCNIMDELTGKNPVEVVLWLVSAKDEEQSALIDFLDKESLQELKAALETYMDINRDVHLLPLYRKFISAL